jgi:hypothetical protein
LTDHERKLMKRYTSTDGDRTPTVRGMARYAREIDPAQIQDELVLIEKLRRDYERRNGKN